MIGINLFFTLFVFNLFYYLLIAAYKRKPKKPKKKQKTKLKKTKKNEKQKNK